MSTNSRIVIKWNLEHDKTNIAQYPSLLENKTKNSNPSVLKLSLGDQTKITNVIRENLTSKQHTKLNRIHTCSVNTKIVTSGDQCIISL